MDGGCAVRAAGAEVHVAFGMAARAVSFEAALADRVQNAFGEYAAGVVSGAEKQHAIGFCTHAQPYGVGAQLEIAKFTRGSSSIHFA
jgi:hypothetical protein